MTEDINFITAIDLKDYLPINYNVDDHRLIMAIDDAEALNIKRILGKKLYVKLKEIIANNEINTNPSYVEYKTLLDEYIFKCVIRYALVEALPWTTFKIENKTTGTTGGENVTPAEISQLSYLIGTVKAKADYHAQELTDYLIQNSTLFPEYHSNSKLDENQPIMNDYFSGMVLNNPKMDPSILIRDDREIRKPFL